MKQNLLHTALIAIALLAFACSDDDKHPDNKLYISASKFTDELLVKSLVTSASRELVVGIAQPMQTDITVKFRAAPELLDTYRQAYYDPDAVILGAEYYSIENPQTEIQAGSVSSAPVTISFVNIDELDRETRYVLPVTIASVTGINALKSASTFYYILKGAALINVVADLAQNKAWPDWKDASPVTDMPTFTLETLIYANAFKNQISTVMGIEGQFLVRIGDAGVDANQIQIATVNGNFTNPNLKLDPNRWYHIAVTYNKGSIEVYIDGEKKLTGNNYMPSVDLGVPHSDESDGKPRCFWVGYSYNDERFFDGRFSEMRIWNKVLTEEEINTQPHFYEVSPDSDGLVAYWKFDDGVGTVVKDYTRFGNDLTIGKQPKWVAVSLP